MPCTPDTATSLHAAYSILTIGQLFTKWYTVSCALHHTQPPGIPFTSPTRWRTWIFFHNTLYTNSCVMAGALVFHSAGHTSADCLSVGTISVNYADFTPFNLHSPKSGTDPSICTDPSSFASKSSTIVSSAYRACALLAVPTAIDFPNRGSPPSPPVCVRVCVYVCSVLLTRWIHMQPGGGSHIRADLRACPLCVCSPSLLLNQNLSELFPVSSAESEPQRADVL